MRLNYSAIIMLAAGLLPATLIFYLIGLLFVRRFNIAWITQFAGLFIAWPFAVMAALIMAGPSSSPSAMTAGSSSIPAALIGVAITMVILVTMGRRKNIIHASSSEGSKLKNHTEMLSVAAKSLSTSTDGKNTAPGFSEPKRASIEARTIHHENDKNMERQRIDQEMPDFYQVAWDELSSGAIHKGIWARAYSETEGNEQKT